jgi:hypothetical protein
LADGTEVNGLDVSGVTFSFSSGDGYARIDYDLFGVTK